MVTKTKHKFKVMLTIITLTIISIWYLYPIVRYKLTKPTILIVFNGEHDKEAENLYYSIQKNTPELLAWIAVCISDSASRDFANRHNLESFAMSNISQSGDYRSKEMNKMTKRKFEAILHLLESKRDVLYVDTDMVILSNPLQHINVHSDINIQNDLCAPPYINSYMCTGFIHIKSNKKTISFVKAIIAQMVKDDLKYGDQSTFNSLFRITKHRLKINLLDPCKFPNGCRYFDNTDTACKQSDALIVHNNYIVGIEKKLQRFKQHSLYFISNTNV